MVRIDGHDVDEKILYDALCTGYTFPDPVKVERLRVAMGAGSVDHGCSRLVLFYPDHVLKLPWLGQNGEATAGELCGHIEVDVKAKADRAGIGFMFNDVELIPFVNGLCACVSPKIDEPFEGNDDCPFISDMWDKGISFDAQEAFQQVYGEKVWWDFCQFVDDNGVDDLHDHNLGWLGGDLVVIDYASMEVVESFC